MEMNGHSIQNGVANRPNGIPQHGERRARTPRILTVDEALPYSPFSSVVPFNSDIIPLPSLGLRSSASIFSNAAERDAGREGLEKLNRLARNPRNTSEKLEKSLNELKELLKPEGLPQYTFKTGPKTRSSSQQCAKTTLTPFAQMVLDASEVEFRVPSPPKPSPQVTTPKSQHKKIDKKTEAKKKSNPSPRPAKNDSSHAANSTITVQIPSKKSAKEATQIVTPPQQLPAQSSPSIQVVIPKLSNNVRQTDYTPHQEPKSEPQEAEISQLQSYAPTITPITPKPPPALKDGLSVVIPEPPANFQAEDYEVMPGSPDTPTHLSRKRRRSEIDGEEDDISRTVDQREKADAAVRNLRDHLLDVFEAEDQIQPDKLGSDEYITASGDGNTLTLTKAAQTKAESHLQKVISLGRFSQAPLDDLLRLQKLSEGALKDAETIDVKVDDSMGDSEVATLLERIPRAELGLRAARTSLRLMSGGREDKQLYSEDVIQAALATFKNVTESCLVPIVEMRSSGPSAALFKLLSAQRKSITELLTQCRRLLSILANLVGSIELSETVVNTLEFTASQLIFVENAPSERDSVLGVAKFDSLRVVAMDVLAQIFQSNPSQRQGIFDEVLTSLERLPVTKQSARQFKLAEGGSIQLVSALIMRLIQTSASKPDEAKAKRRKKALEELNEEAADEALSNGDDLKLTITSESRAEQQVVTAIQELRAVVTPLLESAKKDATFVVGFIVNRAMKSTKSGDAPYRNLLDLFVEDFITCLNSPDWPAAELLLRLFLFKMVHLAEGEKTPAPAKNMALDLLGLMGAAISELNSHVRKSAASIDSGVGGLGAYLSKLAETSLNKQAVASDIVSWPCGPFRASLEYLSERSSGDPQLSSAIGLITAEWASMISTSFDLISDEDASHELSEREYGRLAYRLRNMVTDKSWLSTEYSFDTISAAHARLAYSLTLMNSQFCGSFGRVLTILLGSMTSEQATVRSKSLKSVNQVLDTDPTIIDRESAVTLLILRCANDTSVQVRDSALGLIGKCITLRPALENEMLSSILQRVNDTGVGVRKRAMKLAKDVYLRNSNPEVRSTIADHLLHRVTDLDEGVQELARQTIEEVWMSPFYQPVSSETTSPQFKLAMTDHVALMIKTVQRGSGVSTVLDKVLQNMLSDGSKFASANFRVCKALVATMFETIIDNSAADSHEATSAREALQILTIFAKSNANLFTPDQIHLLQPYVANVNAGDDMAIFRSVVIIFRHVLPCLSKVHNIFLASVRKELLQTVQKVGKAVLEDVVACLWIISSVLDDFQHLTRLVISTLANIQKIKRADLEGPNKDIIMRKLCRLLMIAGISGKHCDLDPQSESFRAIFKSWNGKSISSLMCDTFAPFALAGQALDVRKSALEAIGMVCQSWPKNFPNANISTTFKEVFHSKTTVLETIIMRSFKEFLLLEEKRSEAGTEVIPGATADPTAKLGVMGGGHGDGIALGIAQTYLEFILQIALRSQGDQALLATEVIASITRQGLVHPKVCGTTLIVLETSQNPKIAEIAFREHRASHEKHETILEKEYMRAVQKAYIYQRDVVQNTHGATLSPYTSKLYMMIDILKISKVKNRKRFYDNLCARIDFDPAKMDMVKELPQHLELSQFIIENLAFFDYATVEELLSTINSMEKVVAATGTGIAHAIETEVFQVNIQLPSQNDANGQAQPLTTAIDPVRLQQLTACSMMLSSLWGARSYLRRQYNLSNTRREGKGKSISKDLNKPPVKAPGINGDKFWEDNSSTMSALDSEESMVAQCQAFIDLLNIDPDFKLAAEGDEEAERAKLSTPSDDDDDEDGTPGPPGGSGRGRKRKSSATPSGRKKRARSSSVSALWPSR